MGKRKRRARIDSPERLSGIAAPAARHTFGSDGQLGHDAAAYQVNVSERIALAGDVAYACVRLIADAVADARVGEWRGDSQLPLSRLARRPMASWTRRRWLWRVTATLALYNICHLERVGRDAEGVALSLVPLRPGQLTWDGRRLLIDGRREVAPEDIRTIHRADFPTLSADVATVIALARETFAAAWAADAYRADYWENGGAPAIVLTSDQPLTDDQADTIRDRWTDRRRATPGAPAVLGRGAKAEPLGADIGADGANAALARLGQSVARYFGVPAWLANVESAAGSLVYSNTSSAGLDLVRYTLRGFIGPIEDELSDELPADYLTGRRVELDVTHLTMGTLLERFQAYQIATGDRAWMTPAEIRRELHLPPDAAFDLLDPAGAPAPAMEGIPNG